MPICWRLSPIPPPSSVSGQLSLVPISPKSASTRLTLARPRGVTSPPHAISHETRARSGEDGMESRVERRASAFGRARLDCQNRTSHERGAQKSANMAVATAAADAAFLGHITRGNERTRQRRGREGGESGERYACTTLLSFIRSPPSLPAYIRTISC